MKWIPKKGEKVSVYYDGKRGRRTEGEVVKVQGCFIQVQFQQWEGDKILTAYFPRYSDISFAAFVEESQHGIMGMLGLAGDWYMVCKQSTER